MRARKRKDVHFHFASHPDGEKYWPNAGRRSKVKTHIVEEGHAEMPFFRDIEGVTASVYTRTGKQFLSRDMERGVKVVVGESGGGPPEEIVAIGSLPLGDFFANRHFIATKLNPTMDNIKELFEHEAKVYSFRHSMIEKAIQRSKKPLDARYGIDHSLLSVQLRNMGIESSRDIKPIVFNPAIRVVRKLVLKGSDARIADIEYKRAFVSFLMPKSFFNKISGKDISIATDADFRFLSLAVTAMIDRLPESQLDSIMHSGNTDRILTYNSFPAEGRIPRKKLEEFLAENSKFWRWQENVKQYSKNARQRK